jgi:hypothetical protein
MGVEKGFKVFASERSYSTVQNLSVKRGKIGSHKCSGSGTTLDPNSFGSMYPRRPNKEKGKIFHVFNSRMFSPEG